MKSRIIYTAIALSAVLFFKYAWDNRGNPGVLAERITLGLNCIKYNHCDKD